MSTQPNFDEVQHSDGWILLAIAWAQDMGATLDTIVECADTINHLMPVPDEIEGCVNRLIARDLLRVVGEQFVLSEETRTILAAAGKEPRLKQWEIAEQYLRTCPPSSSPKTIWRLGPHQLSEADAKYRKRFSRQLKTAPK